MNKSYHLQHFAFQPVAFGIPDEHLRCFSVHMEAQVTGELRFLPSPFKLSSPSLSSGRRRNQRILTCNAESLLGNLQPA